MKKFIVIVLTFAMLLGCTSTTFAAAKKPSKYVKVKRATYQKYKKAYDAQSGYISQINKLKAENNKLKNAQPAPVDTSAYEAKITELESENASLQEKLNDQESMNSWVWMCIKSLGISYSDKTWTIPSDFPETFMINGTKYKSVQEGE